MPSLLGEHDCQPGSSSKHEFQRPPYSSIRSRIVAESINANRSETTKPRQRARWTKIKYDGYQSTLDLGDSLNPVQHSKKRKAREEGPLSTVASEGDLQGPPRPSTLDGYNLALRKNAKVDLVSTGTTFADHVRGDERNNAARRAAGHHDKPETSGRGFKFHPRAPHLEPCEVDRTGDDPLMNELDDIIAASRETSREPSHGPDPDYLMTASPNIPPSSQYAIPAAYEAIPMSGDPRCPDMLSQPESRPITQEQLAAEVKSIYAGLTMVESKCIHVNKVSRYNETEEPGMSNAHWQAHIALHRTLLHEHHDFFLASQHPSASPALRHLALKYSMPARMWKHGISSFLNLLRHRSTDNTTSRLTGMAEFLQVVRSMLHSLLDYSPSMADEWEKILDALQEYEDLLQQVSTKHADTWEDPDDATGLYNPCDPYQQYFSQYWHDDDREIPNLPSDGLESNPGLPQQIIDTMSGWLYYGQVIAPDFNSFTKIFTALSLAAHQCRYVCWKLW